MSDVAYILDPKGNRIAMMDGFGNLSEEACLLYAQGVLKAEDKAKVDAFAAMDPLTRDALDGLMMMQSGRRTAIAGLKEEVVARTGAQLIASQAAGSGMQWLRIAAGIALLVSVSIGTYYVAQYVQQQQMAVSNPAPEVVPPIAEPVRVQEPIAVATEIDSSLLLTDTLLAAETTPSAAPIATAIAPPQPAPTDLAAQAKLAEEKKKQLEMAKAKAALEKQKQAELQRLQANKLAQQTTVAAAADVAMEQKAVAMGGARTENELADSDVEVKVMPMASSAKPAGETANSRKAKKQEDSAAASPASASRNAAKREEQARSSATALMQESAMAERKAVESPVAFDQVKTPPRFPGGDMEMYRFINRTRNYSEQMKNDGITGSVNINFTVEKDGRITDINVTKSSNSVLEEDAMRIVKSMPKWTPAENDGTPVRTTRTVVIKYE